MVTSSSSSSSLLIALCIRRAHPDQPLSSHHLSTPPSLLILRIPPLHPSLFLKIPPLPHEEPSPSLGKSPPSALLPLLVI